MANPRQSYKDQEDQGPINDSVIKDISAAEYRRSKVKRVTFPHEKKKRNHDQKQVDEFLSRSTKKRQQHKKLKRKKISKDLFSEFRRNFFKIPSERPLQLDPFYFSAIPNMLALMTWCFLMSLFVMISLTSLFCMCHKYENIFWRTFIANFSFIIPVVCARWHRSNTQPLSRLQHTLVLGLSHSTLVTFSTMVFSHFLPSASHAHIFTVCLFSLIGPIFPFSINNAISFKDHKRSRIINVLMGVSQVLLIYFWTWFPEKIMRVLGNYVGSILVILLLNISKHAYMLAFYLNRNRDHPDTVHATILWCLYYVGFVEFLLFSFVSQDQYFFLLFSYCFVDLFEILYHAKALADQRDPILSLLGYEYTPKTFDIVTNQRSSYICVMEIVEIIVALYFTCALFVAQAFGLHGTEAHTSNSSFVWSLIGFIVWEIFTGLLIRWVLARKKISLVHDQIYLMENEFEIMFIIPLVLVGYLLITWQTFGCSVIV